jgi:hypothetical protein
MTTIHYKDNTSITDAYVSTVPEWQPWITYYKIRLTFFLLVVSFKFVTKHILKILTTELTAKMQPYLNEFYSKSAKLFINTLKCQV